MVRNQKGQEAVEFTFIAALIFFTALLVMLIFGRAISDYVTNKSSVATTAKNPAQSYDTDVKYISENTGYMGTIQTHKPPPSLPTTSINTENILLGNDVQVLYIPSDTKQAIMTTGSSGVSDSISEALKNLALQLEAVAAQDPDNPQIKELSDVAIKMAYEGHLLADAEEWVETAAKRLTSSGELSVPEDNLLCESGLLKNEDPNCDTVISSINFLNDEVVLNTEYDALPKLLNSHISQIEQLNQSLQSMSANLNDPDVLKITDVINTLSSQILTMGLTVREVVVSPNISVSNISQFNSAISSRTTDVKSELIKKHGKQLADTSVNEPIDNNSI